LNEVKVEKLPEVASPLRFASEEAIEKILSCKPGSIGPIQNSISVIVDRSAAALADFVCGANKDGFHLKGVNWSDMKSDFQVKDIRNVVEGDPSPDGKGKLLIKRGIEVGQIFKLGTKYSKAMNATVLDENGKPIVMEMGCYGIGVTRVIAAAIEQNHDANGIIWPEALAPFQIVIVTVNGHKSEIVAKKSEELYQFLLSKGVDVLLDDRPDRPGFKFADMDLIGIPHRLVIGEKGLEKKVIEYKARNESEGKDIAVSEIENFLSQLFS